MYNELDFLSRLVAHGGHSRRAFLGRAAALGLSSAAANMLLSNAAHAAGPVKGGTLKIGMDTGATTDSLDPARYAGVSHVFNNCWGEGLVRLTAAGSLDPLLATEWSSTPDAKVWTFMIRKGVQFHNGRELTPDDVVATVQRHSNPEAKSVMLGNLRGIESVKRNGDTVVFTTKAGNADLPYMLADKRLVIQPNGGNDAPAAAIGTGPYKLGAHDPGVRLSGVRFANYWAPSLRGHAEEIEILMLNDSLARMAALQSGRVHMMIRVDPKVIDMIKRVPGITIYATPGKAHQVFAAHCNTAPFSNLDLRLALKFAINRKEMVEKILQGFGSIGNDYPINNSYPMYSELPQRAYDPDKAAFHYKKSGHDGPVVLRTSEAAFPGAVDAAQLYAAQCAKSGINMEVKREPADGYYSQVWLKQPFCASRWNGRATQDEAYSTVYTTGADWNETKYFNPKLDAMVLAARSELNQAKRKTLYQDIALLIHSDGGAIIPMFNDIVDAVGPKVGGYQKNPNGGLMDGQAAIECWLES